MNPAINPPRPTYTVREFVVHFDHFTTAPGTVADPNYVQNSKATGCVISMRPERGYSARH